MTQFRPRDGLGEVVARLVAPRVQQITDDVAEAAREALPRWRPEPTLRIERVGELVTSAFV